MFRETEEERTMLVGRQEIFAFIGGPQAGYTGTQHPVGIYGISSNADTLGGRRERFFAPDKEQFNKGV